MWHWTIDVLHSYYEVKFPKTPFSGHNDQLLVTNLGNHQSKIHALVYNRAYARKIFHSGIALESTHSNLIIVLLQLGYTGSIVILKKIAERLLIS